MRCGWPSVTVTLRRLVAWDRRACEVPCLQYTDFKRTDLRPGSELLEPVQAELLAGLIDGRDGTRFHLQQFGQLRRCARQARCG